MNNSNSKWSFGIIIFTIFLSFGIFLFSFSTGIKSDPVVVYNVYLDGQKIGTIASKEEFEEFINNKEDQLKKKYDVKTVYTPRGVDIKKNLTYNSSVISNEEVYSKIISNKKFTIQGYEITITPDDKEKEVKNIYVLSKNVFDEAIENTIKAFVDKDKYEKFISGTQEEVKDSGSMIENIDIQENITYKETRIPTDEKIFTDSQELSKYLLYGTLDNQETYVVKDDDTIESIAENHKLNVQEFLIANPEFTSENNLLYESQKVVVGLIKPLISVVVDVHSVGEEERAFDTEIQYDSHSTWHLPYHLTDYKAGILFCIICDRGCYPTYLLSASCPPVFSCRPFCSRNHKSHKNAPADFPPMKQYSGTQYLYGDLI